MALTCEKGPIRPAHFYGVMRRSPSPSRDTGRQSPNPTVAFFGARKRPCTLLDSAQTSRIQLFCCWLKSGSAANLKGGAERMAKAGARVKITLRCSECKQRNYNTNKNKKNNPDRLEMNKYCPFCRKHTVHNETK